MHTPDIIKVRLSELMPHEGTLRSKVEESMQVMRTEGVLKRPIAVYRVPEVRRYLILDGHHRAAALRMIGCNYAIVNSIDYFSSYFKVMSWKGEKQWDKAEIIDQALRGGLRDPKTTRHVIVVEGDEQAFNRNDIVEPVIDCPLNELR